MIFLKLLRSFVKILVLPLFFLLISPVLFAETTYVIDTPTKGMLEYANYDVNFRFFSGGGVLSKMSFGVFKIVNLGVGWEVENLIGTQTAIAAPPSLYLKVKPFTGGMVLPAIAFGYDGQGYFYNKDNNSFLQKERGVFIVFGREILIPDLELSVGLNMNDFKNNSLCGFLNLAYLIEEKFGLLFEYDNINYFPTARVNAGVRLFLTSDINIDLVGRDIFSSSGTAERTVRISYVGKF